jgi:hypothetical protein
MTVWHIPGQKHTHVGLTVVIYACIECTVPHRTHPGVQISEILKVTPGIRDPVNKYFSLPCNNPSGHLASACTSVCVCVHMHIFACACVLVRLCLHMYVCVSFVRHCCVRHCACTCMCVSPTKLYFRQTPETQEPLNKYIFYDTDITPEGKKRYLPGVSTVRYGSLFMYACRTHTSLAGIFKLDVVWTCAALSKSFSRDMFMLCL